MNNNNNTDNTDNKSFDHCKGNDNDNGNWTPHYLVDKIFNDLMENGDNEITKQNKYLVQIKEKFLLFRLKSDKTFFEIYYQDLNNETKRLIENYIKDCKTPKEKYVKLNYIFTEVIASIVKQAEHLIISQKTEENITWIKRSINEIRECVSLRWKLIGDKQNEENN